MVAEKGREAHARDLSERQLSISRRLAFLRAPLCPAGHLPHKGGDWQFTAGSPPMNSASRATSAIGESGDDERQSPPLRGRCPAGQRGARRAHRLPSASFALNDGHALGIGLPYGSMPADKLIDLAQSALALGTTEIRLAPGRALLFLGLPPAACRLASASRNNPRLRHRRHRPAHAHRRLPRRAGLRLRPDRDARHRRDHRCGKRRHPRFILHTAHFRLRQGLRPSRSGGADLGRRRKRSRTCRERDGKGPSCRLQAGL